MGQAREYSRARSGILMDRDRALSRSLSAAVSRRQAESLRTELPHGTRILGDGTLSEQVLEPREWVPFRSRRCPMAISLSGVLSRLSAG